mmetsp:Transcript_10540/g.13218  ORF Transcript_10540/g.13218 Transcript_10540/m.13218 type:complete len:103 (+) Transcript_10540:134-442(+)
MFFLEACISNPMVLGIEHMTVEHTNLQLRIKVGVRCVMNAFAGKEEALNLRTILSCIMLHTLECIKRNLQTICRSIHTKLPTTPFRLISVRCLVPSILYNNK